LKHLDYGESERRAAQVGVDDDAGAVDQWLDAGETEVCEGGADAGEEVGKVL